MFPHLSVAVQVLTILEVQPVPNFSSLYVTFTSLSQASVAVIVGTVIPALSQLA